jgi:predicted nicotinamide N-methyase
MLDLKLELEAILQTVLPDATLQIASLPDCGGLKLYLIDEAYSLEALDAQTQQRVMNNPLYWMFCWASGHAMAKSLTRQSINVKEQVVLDVGSGSGVVAIAAALAGAKQVIASDIDPVSQKAIMLNAQLNACQDKIDVIADLDQYPTFATTLDWILMADVLYDAGNKPLIDQLLPLSSQLCLADSRMTHFTHPQMTATQTLSGKTFPALGGFDEFSRVAFFYKNTHC